MSVPVSLRLAAHELGVSPRTIRNWIVAGAPTAELGDVGRGRGSRVIVADLIAWRRSRLGERQGTGTDALLEHIAESIWDTYSRDAGRGAPAHVLLGIPHKAAAAHLYATYARLARDLTGSDDLPLPQPVQRLLTVAS